MTTSVAHGRRKSGGGSAGSSSSGGAMMGGGRAARLDPSLMMSTRATDEAGRPLGHGGRAHKSSERLHRLGSGGVGGHGAGGSGGLHGHGGSSTNLTKRSKSYSQIMNAAHTGQGKKKGGASQQQQQQQQQHRRRASRDNGTATSRQDGKDGGDDEDEGWTSSDQAATPREDSVQRQDQTRVDDDSDDEGLVLTASKSRSRQQTATAAPQENGALAMKEPVIEHASPPHVDQARPEQKPAEPPMLTRTDTDATVRNVHASTNTVEDPAPSTSTASSGQQNELSRHDDVLVASRRDSPQREANTLTASTEASGSQQRTRVSSSTSLRTLLGDRTTDGNFHSPKSTRSLRTRSALLPRDSRNSMAPPKLTSAYAFAGEHAAEDTADDSHLMAPQHGRRELNSLSSFESSGHYRIGITDPKRKESISSSRSSFINLVSASPSMALLSSQAANAEPSSSQGSRAIEAMQRASSSGFDDGRNRPRQRTRSWQGGSEAAKMASKLRMSNTDVPDRNLRSITGGANVSEAARMLTSSGNKYLAAVRNSGGDSATVKALAQYHKPVVSKFVKREDDFRAAERPVQPGSLYDMHFARASLREQKESSARSKEAASHTAPPSAMGKRLENPASASTDDPSLVRYVMDYGLSGPAISGSPTAQALLSSCLDHDEFESSWAPALAQAAGLGSDGGVDSLHQRIIGDAGAYGGAMAEQHLEGLQAGGHMASSNGFLINGPNATPLHFLHGLTNTDDSPFPLDALDIALPPAAAAAIESGAGHRQNLGNYFDAKNLRAVAQTWAALNAAKNHIMTRRYLDPMRESMDRVGAASGLKSTSASPALAGSAQVSTPSGLSSSRTARAGLAGASSGSAGPDGTYPRRSGSATTAGTSGGAYWQTSTYPSAAHAKRQSGIQRSATSTPSPAADAGANRSNWGWRALFSEQPST